MKPFALSLIPAAFAFAAQAHVTVAPAQALPGASVSADFHVAHGCSGQPTTAFRVNIPAGLRLVSPKPAPGWSLTTSKAGGQILSATWRAATPVSTPADFTIGLQLPRTKGEVRFAAIQTCGKTIVRWSENPALGDKDGHRPAPTITVTDHPAAAAADDDD